MKPIPYGLASYKSIREDNCYYLDKTHYIPQLETTGKFLFFIRPRRFGKSSWLTVLEGYYDINRVDEFDFLFKGTYIYDNPTPEKNSYLILNFNFSEVSPQLDEVKESFYEYTDECFYFFGVTYRELLGDEYFRMIERKKSPHGKLRFLLKYVGMLGHKVYILVDEYDNFANTILSTAGQTAYHELTRGAGFFRFFFNLLKGAADRMDTGVGRMFITGVSPVTMDDVTSGFNIGQQISLYPELNELLGFTKQDVINILEYYGLEPNNLLPLIQEWYDNYRFSSQAEQAMFNTDMVLYFIKNYLRRNAPPEEMIDQNVKIDYGKLRHLIVLDRRLNGNFSYLMEIIETQETKHTQVVSSFPVEHLTKKENFVSLLFYFGLLSHAPNGEDTEGVLQIPNETVKQLMY
ncbi:AAA family ATPase, partial [Anaerolineales bacterium HSG24]|nr:AAA family ATPase [Anaerolineales bacterium HSG24]